MRDLNTIFSVYMQGRGNGWPLDYLGKLKPRVVKIQDGKQSEIDSIKAQTPDSYVINRIYVDDAVVAEDIRNDPEGAAEKHHRLILSKQLSGVDYFQVQNEQLQNPPELELLNRYYVRLGMLAVDAGYRTTVIDCSVGKLHVEEDNPGDWEYVFDTLAMAQEYGFVVNCHQYSCKSFWNPAYDNDWFLHRLEHTAMPVLDAAGFNKLVYVDGEFGLSDLLCHDIKKPGGWQKHLTHEQYRSDLINIMGYLLQWSDRILGYCCYLTHALAPWETHEMLEMNQDLAEFYRVNKQDLKPIIDVDDGGNPGPTPPLFQARVVNAGTLNVRSGPPVNGQLQPIVGTVHLGDVVNVYAIDSGWWEISKETLRGWSSAQYLERIDDQDLQEQINQLKIITSQHQKAIIDHEGRISALEDEPPIVIPPPSDATLSESIECMGMGIVGIAKQVNVLQAFTTHNGSWEVNGSDIYAVEQWARNQYLYPPNHPNYHDDGGGDHHLFVRLDDGNGGFIGDVEVIFEQWNGDQIDSTTKRLTSNKHGWCNIPLFHPAFWTARIGDSQRFTPYAMPTDKCIMPGREHVSLFVVFR